MYGPQNRILSIVLAALVTLIIILYSMEKQDGFNSLDKNMYKISDAVDIDKITLRSSWGNIVLNYDGAHWMVNHKHHADDNMITVLFATLRQVETQRPVALSMRDSVKRAIQKNGVSVTLFSGKNKVKEFYAGGNTKKTKAYFQDAKHGPHLVSIPGYRVYASGIFEVDELGWKNRRIFDFNWRNFTGLSSLFFHHPGQGFTVAKQGVEFAIKELAETDTAKLHDYLDALSLLTAKQMIAKGFSKSYDSLAQTTPLLRITVSDVSKKNYTLDIYPSIPQDKNILAKKDKKTMVLFKKKNIVSVLKKKKYFTSNLHPDIK